MISGGMVIRSTSMNNRFHRVLNWLWKLKSVSWTVRVCPIPEGSRAG